MTHKTLVVTNCTSRKRLGASPVAFENSSAFRSLNHVASDWLRRRRGANCLLPAHSLYVGRAFSEALAVAGLLKAELSVVSAGMGLVSGSDLLPNYDATISSPNSALSLALASVNATPAQWWTALHSGEAPLAARIERCQQVCLVAMPSTYFDLVADDLIRLPAAAAQRLRLFTSMAGRHLVPRHLAHCVMPYDERLEGSEYAGTRNDFPQRAMTHFVRALGAHQRPLADARRAVAVAMERLVAPVLPKRSKKSDEELISLLMRGWRTCGGNSARLLRYLRDDMRVQCEQSRFRDLMKVVRTRLLAQEAA